MITNDFWALGPNNTHYPGGFPAGFLNRLKREGYWGENRLHICSGTVTDGTTIDISREPKGKHQVRPHIQGDAETLPFKDKSFDFVLIDPPYSKEKSVDLYQVSYCSIPKVMNEASRVTKTRGLVVLLDMRTWRSPKNTELVALIAIYMANKGPKPLRALTVYRKINQTSLKKYA